MAVVTRRLVSIEQDGPVIILRGWKARDVARSAGLRPIYSGASGTAGGGWVLDAVHLPSILAWCQHRNISAHVTGTPPIAADPTSDQHDPQNAASDPYDVELDLFGGGAA